ncbi:hypothetical protein [Rhodococcus qingshengii]|uniref:hypothetical protein n=1 Tax=Rhodococcus qingshengii TaxID=334542 RepID=UPI003016F04E
MSRTATAERTGSPRHKKGGARCIRGLSLLVPLCVTTVQSIISEEFSGSFDAASLSTDSIEELNLGKISELLKLGITAVSFITALNSLS